MEVPPHAGSRALGQRLWQRRIVDDRDGDRRGAQSPIPPPGIAFVAGAESAVAGQPARRRSGSRSRRTYPCWTRKFTATETEAGLTFNRWVSSAAVRLPFSDSNRSTCTRAVIRGIPDLTASSMTSSSIAPLGTPPPARGCRCATPRPPDRRLVRLLGPVAAGAAVACGLPADRRGRPVEPPGDLGVGEPDGESGRDALALLLGQPSSWHAVSIAPAAPHCNAPLHSPSASLHQFTASCLLEWHSND